MQYQAAAKYMMGPLHGLQLLVQLVAVFDSFAASSTTLLLTDDAEVNLNVKWEVPVLIQPRFKGACRHLTSEFYADPPLFRRHFKRRPLSIGW